MKKYYIAKGQNQEGPYSLDQLKDLDINKDTMIWVEGNQDWLPASEFNELKEILFAGPPPIPPKGGPNGTATTGERKRRGPVWIIPVLVVVAGLAGIAVWQLRDGSSLDESDYESEEKYQEKVMTVRELEEANPVKFLEANGTYKPNIWDTKFKVDCIVESSATVATYKDVKVRFTFYSKSNTVITTDDKTFYDVFGPGARRTFTLEFMKEANEHTMGWEVIDASIY